MSSGLISLFIDDEMEIDEKIEFVEIVHADHTFRDQTVDLLHQERLLRSPVVTRVPTAQLKTRCRPVRGWSWLRPAALVVPALAALLLVVLFLPGQQPEAAVSHRFVIFQPDARQTGISGSFTNWQTVPLQQIGTSGYWVITLEVPQGEHRFTYIVDGHKRLADPTVPGREQDDFGGQNSVLRVGA